MENDEIDFYLDALILTAELTRDEGRRLKPYRDSLGNWTIGVGHLLVGNELMEYVDVVTGKPRKTLSEAYCQDLLLKDIHAAGRVLDRLIVDWRRLDAVRKRALLNLAVNLGSRLSRFHQFLWAVSRKDWPLAGDSLRKSLWWEQVKRRGPRIVHMIETGTPWPAERE